MATAQVLPKTRPAISCWMCLLFFVITVATLNKAALVNADEYWSPPSTLAVYIHENRLAPNSSLAIASKPSGDTNPNEREFGEIIVIDNAVRESQANDSTQLGQAVGQLTILKDFSFYLDFVLVLNTTSGSGSVAAQGPTDSKANGEVAITGGTGDFRWARGYIELLLLTDANQGDVVYIYTLYLKYT